MPIDNLARLLKFTPIPPRFHSNDVLQTPLVLTKHVSLPGGKLMASGTINNEEVMQNMDLSPTS
eukprot:scaffold90955_cov18-Prasinocladus_malaysianus.AAC.1